MLGTTVGVMKKDARSMDYSSSNDRILVTLTP